MLVPVVIIKVLYGFPSSALDLRSSALSKSALSQGSFICLHNTHIIRAPGLCPQVVTIKGSSTLGKEGCSVVKLI
ncbi:hypothetical protein ES703_69099 [subsurface metagenome]